MDESDRAAAERAQKLVEARAAREWCPRGPLYMPGSFRWKLGHRQCLVCHKLSRARNAKRK